MKQKGCNRSLIRTIKKIRIRHLLFTIRSRCQIWLGIHQREHPQKGRNGHWKLKSNQGSLASYLYLRKVSSIGTSARYDVLYQYASTVPGTVPTDRDGLSSVNYWSTPTLSHSCHVLPGIIFFAKDEITGITIQDSVVHDDHELNRERPSLTSTKVVNSLGISLQSIAIPPPNAMNDNDKPSTQKQSSSRSPREARTSFTADSPYYTSYVENEMRQLNVLTDTLRDISARAKTFGKCGALMAEATRRLALACRLKPSTPIHNEEDSPDISQHEREEKIVQERQESVGNEMMTVLSTLGEVSMGRF